MKIEVSIDLDWIHEDETINEAIQRRVIASVSEKVIAMVDTQKQNSMAAAVNAKLDAEINEILSGFLSKGFQETDNWGEPKGEPIKIIDLLKSRLENYFLESVNSEGKKTNYHGTPRYKHILDRDAQRIIDKFHKDLSNDVIQGIKKDINDEARKRITDSILSDYDLKKLVK